jgi:dihydrofolate reductase
MAISLNGIIARENNKEDFFSDDNWITFVELCSKSGCMIWGRKTYEVVRGWEKEYSESISDIKKVIISSDKNFIIKEGYIKATSPKDALNLLSKQGFKEVILSGGSRLNTSFAKEGLIDEIILNVNSIVVGKGIPLFSPEEFDLKLELMETKKIKNNLIQLRYKVEK